MSPPDSKGTRPPWLIGIKRRTLKDKGRRREPEEIYKMIVARTWPYKTKEEFYYTRDRAFLSLLYLCCGRIGEVLRLKKNQFEERIDFVLVNDYQVEKTNLFRDEWPLPKTGQLAPLTKLVQAHLKQIEEELFRFKRQRGHWICKHITTMWPHWFRAMGESYYMKIVKDPYVFAVGLRLVDPKTLMEYIPFEWRDYKEQLLK